MTQIIDSASACFCSVFLPGSGFLSMLTLLFLFGAIITSWILYRTGALVREIDEPEKKEGPVYSPGEPQKPMNGDAVKLAFFTLKSRGDVIEWEQRMPERSLSLLLKWLRFDYWFMFFCYPFLSFLIALFTRYTCLSVKPDLKEISTGLILLPLLTGLMDVFENLFATWVIEGKAQPNKHHVNFMRVFSVLKWLGVLFILITIIVIVWAFIGC